MFQIFDWSFMVDMRGFVVISVDLIHKNSVYTSILKSPQGYRVPSEITENDNLK